MSRPTIHDVAETARVSLATVDRVLNKRGGVAQKSVLKVMDAVEKTGYVRDEYAANLSRGHDARLVFVLPPDKTSFLESLRTALRAEARRLTGERIIFEERTLKDYDILATARNRPETGQKPSGCLALMAQDVPDIRAAVQQLAETGMPVLTLVSDLPGSARAAFVGIDNVMAGRTAGRFMARLMPDPKGPVQIIAGSLAARDHAERLMGFQQVMRDYPGIEVLPVVEGQDDPARVQALAARALGQPLAGLYAIGAGNRGLAEALRQHKGPRPTTIAHELTPHTRAALQDDLIDLVIDQDPTRAARRAVTLMRDLSAGRPVAVSDGDIPLNIYIKENLP